jgi:hypothetical protein
MANETIAFDAVIERLAPEVPRFVVYPGKAWDETATFMVEVALNGVPIGLRSLAPWKERGWFFGVTQPICDKVRLETGDPVRVEMRRVGDAIPPELDELIQSSRKVRQIWEDLDAGERRDLVQFVAAAKKAETRARRARRLIER